MNPDFDVLDHGGWHGMLNEESLEPIVKGIRKLLVGKMFLVVSANYLSSWDPRIEVSQNERLNSSWTTAPCSEPVRIFEPKKDETLGRWFGFSTGGYFYSYHPAPKGVWENGEKGKYPFFSFDTNRQTLTIKTIAPSGDTHQSIFQVQQDIDKE